MEHMMDHPQSPEDIKELSDDIINRLHFEAKFLENTFRRALAWTMDKHEESDLGKIKRQLEDYRFPGQLQAHFCRNPENMENHGWSMILGHGKTCPEHGKSISTRKKPGP